ncbi:hypothetical protein [Pleionea sediminis]|uniref:hypothetical protein n=1 Tax=Pleionea sediminis TaxID=2569479 RepID=UPI001186026A|nr:hypothetical protein [Pleionea sediminis]
MKEHSLINRRLQRYPGSFEVHMTVDLDHNSLDSFKLLCEEINASFLIIVLDKGSSDHQPMLSKVFSNPDNACKSINDLIYKVAEQYDVVRVKIEASLDNHGLPLLDDDALIAPDDCYYEFHVRLKLPLNADIATITKQLNGYHAYVSQNALKNLSEYQLRFATIRVMKKGRTAALSHLQAFIDYLNEQQIGFDKVIKEYNIFDSNISLDAGWMNNL